LVHVVLNNEHVTTEEITGDLVSGFAVNNIRAVDENGERQFELDRFYFRYNGLFSILFSKEIVIEEFTITNLFWRLPKLEKHKDETRDTEDFQSEQDGWDNVRSFNDQDNQLERFAIKKLLFTDIHIAGPTLETLIEINEFRITDFEAVKNRDPEIGEFLLKSNFLDLGLENITFGSGETFMIRGALKQRFLARFGGRKPVTFYLGVKGSSSGFELMSISAFDDAIQFYMQEDFSVEIFFDNYSPGEYFNGADPVQELTAQIVSRSGDKDEGDSFNRDSSAGNDLRLVSGSFVFGQTKYTAVPGALVLIRETSAGEDGDEYEVAITGKNPANPSDVIVLILDAKTPGFIKVHQPRATDEVTIYRAPPELFPPLAALTLTSS